MSAAPINVSKDDLKINSEEVRNVGEKAIILTMQMVQM